MHVDVHWREIRGNSDDAWRLLRVLYAYLDPETREILYLGKAHGCTVHRRWTAEDKDDLAEFMAEQGVDVPMFLVGDLALDGNYSKEILADVESLLIKRLRPRGNVQCKNTRGVSRPGMRVVCHGPSWPAKKSFADRG